MIRGFRWTSSAMVMSPHVIVAVHEESRLDGGERFTGPASGRWSRTPAPWSATRPGGGADPQTARFVTLH